VLRQWILEEVPQNAAGLDVARAANFLEEQRLRPSQAVVVDEAGRAVLARAYPEGLNEAGLNGSYAIELDLAFLFRRADLDQASEGVFYEGILVHDLAHSCTAFKLLLGLDSGPAIAGRSGFETASIRNPEVHYGSFFEEGFADLQRGRYIEKYLPLAGMAFLNRLVGSGVEHALDFLVALPRLQDGSQPHLPFKYLIPKPAGKVHTSPSAHAAFGLELLIQREPRLEPLLLEARSDPAALKALPAAVDSVSSGLFHYLWSCRAENSGFARAANQIGKALFGGR
jgi:hypothetical protein